jgi:hypothetical protein
VGDSALSGVLGFDGGPSGADTRYRELSHLWIDLELALSRHRQRLLAAKQGDP